MVPIDLFDDFRLVSIFGFRHEVVGFNLALVFEEMKLENFKSS